jgi:nicotinate-nucleotide--dimethylbenzimidazole phosphoribosyltransferase
MLDRMNLKPLLDLDLRLGEGTGAALGMFIVEAGVKVLTEMLTFEEAQVTDGQRG